MRARLPQADLEVELAFGLNLFRLNANFFGDSRCLTPEISPRNVTLRVMSARMSFATRITRGRDSFQTCFKILLSQKSCRLP